MAPDEARSELEARVYSRAGAAEPRVERLDPVTWRTLIRREGDRMSKPVLITIGIVLALLGAIFTLQGLGFIGGSAMTGSTLWAILGPIIAVVGIVLVVVGLRRGRRS